MWRDFLQGLRQLRRQPGFALAAGSAGDGDVVRPGDSCVARRGLTLRSYFVLSSYFFSAATAYRCLSPRITIMFPESAGVERSFSPIELLPSCSYCAPAFTT